MKLQPNLLLQINLLRRSSRRRSLAPQILCRRAEDLLLLLGEVEEEEYLTPPPMSADDGAHPRRAPAPILRRADGDTQSPALGPKTPATRPLCQGCIVAEDLYSSWAQWTRMALSSAWRPRTRRQPLRADRAGLAPANRGRLEVGSAALNFGAESGPRRLDGGPGVRSE